ncbi:hypothetical protein WN67_07720 [Mycolicibacterium obuense]|uniref:Uncharacterized protein n=1 Tax=Mycolicibacterium obuense TaxID=1807 RepID=A0A0M2K114_9MYCO|nr:hypothetical protein WN67_07720 [Mycolicibacterium obuense]
MSNVPLATSRRMRSPSRTNAMGPPSTTSGAMCPTHSPVVPPENRPSVISSMSLPRPAQKTTCVDDADIVGSHPRSGVQRSEIVDADRRLMDNVDFPSLSMIESAIEMGNE